MKDKERDPLGGQKKKLKLNTKSLHKTKNQEPQYTATDKIKSWKVVKQVIGLQPFGYPKHPVSGLLVVC